MKRIAASLLLALHALAHVSAATWSRGTELADSIQLLFATAFTCFLASSIIVAHVTRASRWWKVPLATGVAASMIWLPWSGVPFAMGGLLVNVAVAFVYLGVLRHWLDLETAGSPTLTPSKPRRRWFVRVALIKIYGIGVYCAIVVFLHPTITRWGSTSAERQSALPGDVRSAKLATYRLDHAITIAAPANAVWPWLMQLGQDRGGFYSYVWLERLFGVSIQNADRIHADWQHRAVGDTVFATQASYLGGRAGKLGWRIGELETDRVMVLDKWGSFVLVPINANTTRFIVRTRGYEKPGALAFGLGPFNTFVFEPAHFIMQRAMLKGIRQRAERNFVASAK